MASSGEQLNGNNQHSVFQMASILLAMTPAASPVAPQDKEKAT